MFNLFEFNVKLFFKQFKVVRYNSVGPCGIDKFKGRPVRGKANPDYLEMASRIQNCSMLEIKQKLNTRQPDFWKSLTSSLLSQETAISSNRSLRLGKRFFHICEIISRYVSAQMEMAEQQKQEKEDRDLDMKSIMQAAKDDAERLIPEERMQKMIDGFSEKYGKKFAEFKAEFRTRYMQSKAAVAPLTSIDSHWIHLDNLFPVFAGHMDSIQSNLLRHYIKVMERHLKTGNRINNEVFYSKENFEQDILRTIREMDGFLAESLERPNVISEALVHHLKRQGKVRSPEELRAHLMVFFHARTLLFLPLAEIFNLNLGEIFDRAFTHLPLWRQILIRVLGRYNTLQEKYIGRSFNSYKRLMKDEMKDRQDMMPERKADQQSGRSRADSQSRKRGDGRSPQRYTLNRPSRRSQSTHSSKPRSYNPNEREEAWRKFGETLNG